MQTIKPSSSSHSGKHGLIQCNSSGLLSDMKLCSNICKDAICYGDDDDIRISYTKEEPLTWHEKITQPFVSCGVCQDDEEKRDAPPPMDLGTLVWYLSGMEFLRLSCVEPDVMESFNDEVIITGLS